MIGLAVLIVVCGGLATTVWVQFQPFHRGRTLLNLAAIVPEWRFFAQASITAASDLERDVHLVVRDRFENGRVGGWQPVLHHAERRLSHAIWNPRMRDDELILSMAEDLSIASLKYPDPLVRSSRHYLVLLRRSLEAPREQTNTVARQFAVVYTTGRQQRALSIGFISDWHRW